MPYSHLMQALRVAVEERNDQIQERRMNAAFIGWQVVSAWGGEKVGNFQKYAKNLGVLPSDAGKPTQEEIDRDRKKAQANVKRVIEAFGQGTVRVS